MGQRDRVHRALDERQQGQLGGHPALLDFLDDVEQVAAAAVEHPLQVVGALQIEALLLGHQRGVELGHRKAGADAVPQVARQRGFVAADPAGTFLGGGCGARGRSAFERLGSLRGFHDGDRRGRFGQLSGGRRDRRATGSQQQRNRADQQPGGERNSCGADGFKKALQGRPLST